MKALPRRKGNVSSLERQHLRLTASMKAPPKRKGNAAACATAFIWTQHLNEGPYKIVGKSLSPEALPPCGASLNESPSQKEGKYLRHLDGGHNLRASMKVSARKRRNAVHCAPLAVGQHTSMKDLPKKRKGNRDDGGRCQCLSVASMKVPTKKQGNWPRRA